MSATYAAFLASKVPVAQRSGVEVDLGALHPQAHPFQRDLTRWALRKGRGALFCDTGLGKTLMQLDWARHAAERTLILAPLAEMARRQIESDELAMAIAMPL